MSILKRKRKLDKKKRKNMGSNDTHYLELGYSNILEKSVDPEKDNRGGGRGGAGFLLREALP